MPFLRRLGLHEGCLGGFERLLRGEALVRMRWVGRLRVFWRNLFGDLRGKRGWRGGRM